MFELNYYFQCLAPIVAAKSRSLSHHPICWCIWL